MHRACCRDGCLRPGRRWGGDVHHLTEHAAAAHFAHERLTLFGESEKTEVGSGYQAAEQEVAVEEEVGQEADVAERLDHLALWRASAGRSGWPSASTRRTSGVMSG